MEQRRIRSTDLEQTVSDLDLPDLDARDRALLSAERERIAHELHHRVIRELLTLTLEIDSVAARVQGEPQVRLVELGRSVERATREIRTAVFGLSRSIDDAPPLGELRPVLS
jgi:signal transduction histidine kinase